jgi:CheY-specific phosphatase CheX
MAPQADSQTPTDMDLVEVLKDAVQEVFCMMVSNFCETTIVSEPEDGALGVEGEFGTPERVEITREASVKFHGGDGEIEGSVLLRCSTEGALDIARGFLMTDEGAALEVEEINDALGECANMVTGVVKTQALDPRGSFEMGIPEVSEHSRARQGEHLGSLAYRLTEGMISVEVWVKDKADG